MRKQDLHLTPVAEVAMNPATFAKSLGDAHSRKALAGFEFEVCVPTYVINPPARNQAELPADFAETAEQWIKGVSLENYAKFLAYNHALDGGYSDEPTKLLVTRRGLNLRTAYYRWIKITTESVINQMVKELYEKISNVAPPQDFVLTAVQRGLNYYESTLSRTSQSTSDETSWVYLSRARLNDSIYYLRQELRNGLRDYKNSSTVRTPEQDAEFLTAEINHFNDQIGEFLEPVLSQLWDLHKDFVKQEVVQNFTRFARELANNTTANTVGDILDTGRFKLNKSLGRFSQLLKTLWYIGHGHEVPSNQSSEDVYKLARRRLAELMKDQFGQVRIFNRYHQEDKNATDWYIEPDGSLRPNELDGCAEVVSPPMPIEQATAELKKFFAFAKQNKLYTNDSTGLHINMSIPEKTDLLKLAMFLGDDYVLKMFGRLDSNYARSIIRSLQRSVKSGRKVELTELNNPSLAKALDDALESITEGHMSSVSFNGKYFSFRHAGGDYLNKPEEILNTYGRFARVLLIASTPDMYAKEYKSKIAKFLVANQPEKKTTTRSPELIKNEIERITEQGIPAARLLILNRLDSNERFKNEIDMTYTGQVGKIIWHEPATEAQFNEFVSEGHGLSEQTKEVAREADRKYRAGQGEPRLWNITYIPDFSDSVTKERYQRDYYTDGEAFGFYNSSSNRIGIAWGGKENLPADSQEAEDRIRELKLEYRKAIMDRRS